MGGVVCSNRLVIEGVWVVWYCMYWTLTLSRCMDSGSFYNAWINKFYQITVPELPPTISPQEDTFQSYINKVTILIDKMSSYLTSIHLYNIKSQERLQTKLNYIQIQLQVVYRYYIYFSLRPPVSAMASISHKYHICYSWYWSSHITSLNSETVCNIPQLWPWTWHHHGYIPEDFCLV